MKARNWNAHVWVVLLASSALLGACKRVYTYAVVPRPSNGNYRPDTLRAYQNGNEVRVIFRFDTVTHTRTLYRTDTLWKDGKLVIRDTVRLIRRDTIRIVRRDTVRVTRVDTVRMAGYQAVGGGTPTPPRRVDTVRVVRPDTIFVMRADTIHITHTFIDTVRMNTGPSRVDTIRLTAETIRYISRVDTLRRVDTVRVVRTDTVRVASSGTSSGSSGRKLFVPPGHYPPDGQCRVWIQDMPPGRQRDPAQCDKLGAIPAGAFVLFGGVAWDFDHDWVAAGDGSAPPQIIALQRKR